MLVKDSLTQQEKRIKQLGPGSHFGEVSLLTVHPRTATVSALNYCTIAKLPREDFIAMTKRFPNTVKVMKS